MGRGGKKKKVLGPTFRDLVDTARGERESLLQVVASRTQDDLAAVVIGKSVYGVFSGLPQFSAVLDAVVHLKTRQSRMDTKKMIRWMNDFLQAERQTPDKEFNIMTTYNMKSFLDKGPLSSLAKTPFKAFKEIVKKFLVRRLFEFDAKQPLYKGLPEFPAENNLRKLVLFVLNMLPYSNGGCEFNFLVFT
ncbi:unnamed protein product [Nippostrongylus brasiliensis]|uniref:Nucleolar protein 14 n=1 Tax=Nippostrongylus brasiliensis TaxID=27835 RepID=A0A0N4YXB1_NIPBR|nr:unnamed protein product [Nippostrongylus brasiliensis]